MHARLPRSEIHRYAPTCLCLYLTSEHCTNFQIASTPTWSPTGGQPTNNAWCRPPVDHLNMLQTRKCGRAATFIGLPTRKSCQAPICCNKEQEGAQQCICKVCVHNHSPYHFLSSRECGIRLSNHQPSIAMHDGREAKFV